MNSAPLKDVPLSAEDHRRILYWARIGALEAIDNAERELARHAALVMLDHHATQDVCPNRFGGESTREDRMNDLRKSLLAMRHTMHKLLDVSRNYQRADGERSAAAIVDAVLTNRAADRTYEDEMKTVGGT